MQNNWTINQTKELFNEVYSSVTNGNGLVAAFEKLSKSCNRSINSVRNYYYSQLKMFELVPKLADDLGVKIIKSQREEFEFFSEGEMVSLIETILVQKASGRSVRAIITEMSDGDSKKALRLQNKYRSLISHHKEKVIEIMNELSAQKIAYYNPYYKQIVDGSQDNLKKFNEYIGKLDASEIGSFLNIIKKLM